MSQWLSNVDMYGVVQEVDTRVNAPYSLLSVNGIRLVINQLLFADDTTLEADSEEKLFRLVS